MEICFNIFRQEKNNYIESEDFKPFINSKIYFFFILFF